MNKQRRKELYAIQNRLYNISSTDKETVDIKSIQGELEDIKSDLECLYYEEEAYMDNIPENLQNSSRYEAAEDACDNLESAVDSIDDAISSDDFEDIVDAIEDAINYIDEATM